MKLYIVSILLLGILLLAACALETATSPAETPSVVVAVPSETAEAPAPTAAPTDAQAAATVPEFSTSFELTSTAFTQGEPIPEKFSCQGEDVSPPLTWGDPPAGTQSLALIMDDPDAPGGTWDHWILFNISPDKRELQENLPITGKNVDPQAIFVGKNSWGRAEYGGPCPPSGTHRYFFKLYALDTVIDLLPGASKKELLQAMDGHILAQAELMGTFSR